MVGILLQGFLQLIGVAHFQKAHLGVALLGARLHGIEDVLQLALHIQHGVRGFAFVRRAHGHQDFQRRGLRHPRPTRRAPHPPAQAHTGQQRQRLARQAQGFPGQGEQSRVVGFNAHIQRATGVHRPQRGGQRGAHFARAQQRAELIAQRGQIVRHQRRQALRGVAFLQVTTHKGGEGLRQVRAEGNARLPSHARAIAQRFHGHRTGHFAAQAQGERDALGFGRKYPQRRFAAAAQDGVHDQIEVIHAAAHQALEQRRHGHMGIQHHRNQAATFFHLKQRQCADFGVKPPPRPNLAGEEHQPDIAVSQPLVDGLNEVVAGSDFPLVQPSVDATGTQARGKGFHGGFVHLTVAAKDSGGCAHDARPPVGCGAS